MLDKKAIRDQRLAARRALTAAEAAEKSAAICAAATALPEFERASAVLTYVASKDNEVDTQPLILRLLEGSRPVLVPVTLGKGQMRWSRLESMDELAPTAFGVLEPRGDYRRDMAPPPDSLVLVPGLAFTESGWRIGYGGGYFDRFLAEFSGRKIAVAYALQLIPEMPVEAHDIPMDLIVTESRVYRCSR